MARDALQVHLDAERLDADGFARRVAACEQAVDQTELLRIFADLPAPRPQLPSAEAPAEADEDMPPGVLAGCLALGLGIPVAIVVGAVYGTWWALAVPVAVTVAMAYVEHLRRPAPNRTCDGDPRASG
ncbi:DUF1707 domain-containing protein [Micromonospora inyonensis]|uniref:DUF1707 domain-containing protein n=1 Tax=Micromonospora inyonensis TaxID=47866 RepID=A0A1C6S547_9ACTN|nr:DUF1707 domain-containing protein [Micromonospora inyonensis]SCL24597.1 hypothetical protein GA0074694_3976 [Micromonospora inyonensis]